MKSSLGLVANGLRTCIYQLPGWVNVGVLRESFDYPLYRYDRSSVFPCGFPCSHMHMDGRNVVLHDMGSDQRVCLILTSVQRVSLDLAVVQKEKSVADEFGEPVELRSRCSDGAIGPHNEKFEWLESEASERRISSRVAKRYDEASIKECSSDPSESVYEPRCSSFVEDCAWDDSCGLDSNRLTNRPDTNALPVNRSVSDRPGGWSGDRAGGGSNKDVPSEGPSGGGDGSDDGSGPSGSDDGGSDDGGSDDGGSNDGRSNDGGSDGSDRSDRSDSNGSNAPPDAGADRGESGGSGSGPSKDGGAGKPNNDPNRDESGKHNGNPGKRESDKRNGDPNGDESATSDKDQDGDGSNRSDNSSEGGPDNDKSEVGDRFDGGLGDKRGSALGGAGSENGGCGSETRDGEFDNGRRGEGGEGFGGRSKEVKEPRPAPIEQRTDGLSQDFRRNSRIASGRRNNRASVRSFADGRGFGYAAPHSALETRIDVRSIGNRQVKMIAYGSERTPLCLVNAHHNSHVRGSYRLDLQNKAPVQSEKLAKLQAVFLKPPDAGRNEPVNAARRSQAVVVHGRKSRLYRGASGNEEGSGSDAARHRYTTHFPDTGKTPGAGVPRGARGMQDGGKWGRSRNFGYSLVGPCAKGASRDLPGENDVRPVVGLSGAADARRLGGSGAASGAESCGFEQGPTGLDEVRLERELRDVEAGRLALAVEPSSTGSGAETDASVPVVSSEGGDGAGEREVGAASGGAFELVGAEGEGAAGVLGEGERYGEEDADAELGGGVERQESGADVEERSLFASVVEGEVAEMIRGLASGAGPEVKKEVESVLEDSGATGGGSVVVSDRGEREQLDAALGGVEEGLMGEAGEKGEGVGEEYANGGQSEESLDLSSDEHELDEVVTEADDFLREMVGDAPINQILEMSRDVATGINNLNRFSELLEHTRISQIFSEDKWRSFLETSRYGVERDGGMRDGGAGMNVTERLARRHGSDGASTGSGGVRGGKRADGGGELGSARSGPPGGLEFSRAGAEVKKRGERSPELVEVGVGGGGARESRSESSSGSAWTEESGRESRDTEGGVGEAVRGEESTEGVRGEDTEGVGELLDAVVSVRRPVLGLAASGSRVEKPGRKLKAKRLEGANLGAQLGKGAAARSGESVAESVLAESVVDRVAKKEGGEVNLESGVGLDESRPAEKASLGSKEGGSGRYKSPRVGARHKGGGNAKSHKSHRENAQQSDGHGEEAPRPKPQLRRRVTYSLRLRRGEVKWVVGVAPGRSKSAAPKSEADAGKREREGAESRLRKYPSYMRGAYRMSGARRGNEEDSELEVEEIRPISVNALIPNKSNFDFLEEDVYGLEADEHLEGRFDYTGLADRRFFERASDHFDKHASWFMRAMKESRNYSSEMTTEVMRSLFLEALQYDPKMFTQPSRYIRGKSKEGAGGRASTEAYCARYMSGLKKHIYFWKVASAAGKSGASPKAGTGKYVGRQGKRQHQHASPKSRTLEVGSPNLWGGGQDLRNASGGQGPLVPRGEGRARPPSVRLSSAMEHSKEEVVRILAATQQTRVVSRIFYGQLLGLDGFHVDNIQDFPDFRNESRWENKCTEQEANIFFDFLLNNIHDTKVCEAVILAYRNLLSPRYFLMRLIEAYVEVMYVEADIPPMPEDVESRSSGEGRTRQRSSSWKAGDGGGKVGAAPHDAKSPLPQHKSKRSHRTGKTLDRTTTSPPTPASRGGAEGGFASSPGLTGSPPSGALLSGAGDLDSKREQQPASSAAPSVLSKSASDHMVLAPATSPGGVGAAGHQCERRAVEEERPPRAAADQGGGGFSDEGSSSSELRQSVSKTLLSIPGYSLSDKSYVKVGHISKMMLHNFFKKWMWTQYTDFWSDLVLEVMFGIFADILYLFGHSFDKQMTQLVYRSQEDAYQRMLDDPCCLQLSHNFIKIIARQRVSRGCNRVMSPLEYDQYVVESLVAEQLKASAAGSQGADSPFGAFGARSPCSATDSAERASESSACSSPHRGGGRPISNFLPTSAFSPSSIAASSSPHSKGSSEREQECSIFPAPSLDESTIESLLLDKPLDLFSIQPLEVARQRCLLDHRLMCSIPIEDFIWYGQYPDQVPIIAPIAQDFNRTSSCVAKYLFEASGLLSRVQILQYFITLASELLTLQNYHGFLVYISALSQIYISRLKKTWKKVDKKVRKRFIDMQQLALPTNNFAALRSHCENVNSPFILPPAVFLKDLIFTFKGGNDPGYFERDTQKPVVQKEKLLLLGKILAPIQTSRRTKYKFWPLKPIQQLLIGSKTVYTNEELEEWAVKE